MKEVTTGSEVFRRIYFYHSVGPSKQDLNARLRSKLVSHAGRARRPAAFVLR